MKEQDLIPALRLLKPISHILLVNNSSNNGLTSLKM